MSIYELSHSKNKVSLSAKREIAKREHVTDHERDCERHSHGGVRLRIEEN